MPRILVVHNQPVLPADHPEAESEHEIVAIAAMVRDVLLRAGYQAEVMAVGEPCALVERLGRDRPAAVFNLFEGTARDGASESVVAGLLEWLGIPFTGCPSTAMTLARHKQRAKYLLRGAGLPTPHFHVIESSTSLGQGPLVSLPRLRWPVIVKPALQDGSVGIDQGSVVSSAAALTRRAEELLHAYPGPVLVEEFIDGREFNAAVVTVPRPQALPLSEIVFHREGNRWPIVTYEAKWRTGSAEDLATRPVCPAEVTSALAERLQELAWRAFALFDCRDYARIDLRLTPDEEPFILEVNPNPGYHPEAGLARALAAAGRSWEGFTVELVRKCLTTAAP